jgi:hypothetical protein
MRLRTNLITAAHLLALLALTALLLRGCGGSGSSAITTGVTGYVVDADTHLGIGNITVRVGGASGVSDAARSGLFTVAASPGVQMLSVDSTDIFVPAPPGTPVPVTVVGGSVTYVGNVWVVDRNSLPPSG